MLLQGKTKRVQNKKLVMLNQLRKEERGAKKEVQSRPEKMIGLMTKTTTNFLNSY